MNLLSSAIHHSNKRSLETRFFLLLAFAIFIVQKNYSQTTLVNYDFSSSTGMSLSHTFDDGADDYCKRDQVFAGLASYSLVTGSNYLIGAEDTDAEPQSPSDGIITLDFDAVNITGYSDLKIELDISANTSAAYDQRSLSNGDYLDVQVNKDNGGWVTTGAFCSQAGSNTRLYNDADIDGIGGESGETILDKTVKNFSFSISGTGSSLDFRIVFRFESGSEEIAFDNVKILGCLTPTSQATAFGTSNITASQMDVSWTRGNGNTVLVVAREGSAVNTHPTNGISYTANAAFGSGNQIGTGNYVVYNGTGTSVTVTGLMQGTTYHYAIYEFNSTGYCYLTPPLTGNATTNSSAASITHSGTSPASTNIAVSSTDNILYQIQVTVATASATLNQVVATTAGTWVAADIANFKLRYSTDATLSAGDATLATLTNGYAGGAGDITFSSLSQVFSIGTAYLFITCDVASGATIGNTIQTRVDADGDFTYSVTPNYSGSSFLTPGTMTIVGLPELQLEHPVGTNVACGFTLSFGSVNVGFNSSLTVRIRNAGTADLNLTNLPLTISGTDASQFSITTQPSTPIASGSFSDMVVQFSPTSTGAKTASISISNNDGDENPCTISLSGTGAVAGLFYRSKATGSWTSTGSWQVSTDNSNWIDALTTPTDANLSITVRNTHTLTVSATLSIDETTIESGGTIDHTGGTLTIANGTGTDLSVSGTLQSANTITTTGTIAFQNGAFYKHNYTTSAGTIPTATWNTGSTVQIIGYTNPTTGFFPAGATQTFSNFTWNTPSLSTNPNMSGATLTVVGTFTMTSTGSGELRLGTNSSGTIVCGSYAQSGGTINCAAGSGIGTIRISGEFNVSGGSITETSSGSGTIEFNGSTEQAYIKSSGTFSNNLTFTITNGAIVNFSTYVLDGTSVNFTNASGGTLKTAHASGIAGTIAVTGTKTFNAAANYEFQTGTSGNTGISTANNVTINFASGVTLSNSLTVNGTLTFTSGILNTGSSQLLTLGSAATVSGANSSKYVSGPLAKTTASTSVFTFPIGKGGQYRTLAIEPSSTSSTTFTAEFFYSEPANRSNLTTPVQAVHSLEYFDLARSGSANARVTLAFEAPSGFVGSMSDLLVAHYDNNSWVKEGTTPSTSGGVTSGTVGTDNYVSTFSPFAIGSSNAANSPLPVELIDFQGKINGSKVLLEWKTASENQLESFFVERAENAASEPFSEIGSRAAIGFSSEINRYQFVDELPSTENFYRLRIVDFDGITSFSQAILVAFPRESKFLIFPNPFSGNEITLLLPDEFLNDHLRLEIFSAASGQRIKSISAVPEPALKINLPDLPPGIYSLLIIAGSGATRAMRFIGQ